MTGVQLAKFSLYLNKRILSRFRPSLDDFEKLEFSVKPDRVVVHGPTPYEDRDMAVVHLPVPAGAALPRGALQNDQFRSA